MTKYLALLILSISSVILPGLSPRAEAQQDQSAPIKPTALTIK